MSEVHVVLLPGRRGILAFLAALAAFLLAGAASAEAAVLYDQYGNAGSSASSSQDFETAHDANDDRIADDFVVPAGQRWSVTGVDVDGQYFNGSGPAASVNVSFYENGSGNLPGTQVANRPTSAFTGAATGDFVISLSTPVILNPGTYWVSVQARQDFNPAGQWGWQDRTVTSNSGAAFQNPGGGFGIPACQTWARKPTCVPAANGADQVFRLNGSIANPVLTVTENGSGVGTVTSSPGGINCGADCSESYASGTNVTLLATPAAGSSFTGWSGDCTAFGVDTCTLTMDPDRSVTANFTLTAASQPQAPDTSITKSKVKRRKRKAAFEFTASGTDLPVTFQCKLDDGAFASCTSPAAYKHLKPGMHSFEVAAEDSSGQVDATPASRQFTIKRKHHH